MSFFEQLESRRLFDGSLGFNIEKQSDGDIAVIVTRTDYALAAQVQLQTSGTAQVSGEFERVDTLMNFAAGQSMRTIQINRLIDHAEDAHTLSLTPEMRDEIATVDLLDFRAGTTQPAVPDWEKY